MLFFTLLEKGEPLPSRFIPYSYSLCPLLSPSLTLWSYASTLFNIYHLCQFFFPDYIFIVGLLDMVPLSCLYNPCFCCLLVDSFPIYPSYLVGQPPLPFNVTPFVIQLFDEPQSYSPAPQTQLSHQCSSTLMAFSELGRTHSYCISGHVLWCRLSVKLMPLKFSVSSPRRQHTTKWQGENLDCMGLELPKLSLREQ